MSIDRPAASPAISDSGLSQSSRTTKRWSGAGLISSSGGGLNAVSVEVGDFEDIDLGRDYDPGDDDSKPRFKRNQSELTGLGIRRSRSPFESGDSSKVWRKTSPKRGSIGLGTDSPKRGSVSETSRPTSKRGVTVPGPLGIEAISNGHTPNMRKVSRHRRTSSEIERVYDSDDSVPPETVFYNIPVSPSRLPQSRKFQKFQSSLNEDDQRPPTVTEEGSPKSIVSNTEPTRRPSPGVFPRRVVSYHEAVDALDDESKRLTREFGKINVQSGSHEDRNSGETTPNTSKPLPALARQSRRAASHTHLPSTSTLIDPLPPSKEKEAVLSQTRPSWLPPKKKSEEKRHLAEYQKMVQQAEEAELKRQQHAQLAKEERDRLYEDSSKVWQTYILPNWHTAIQDPRTRGLWWSGVPSARRGVIWQKCIGNGLSVTEDTFNRALGRVSDAERSIRESTPDDELDTLSSLFRRIQRDCASVFQDLKIFQPGGPLYDDLVSVTKAYAFYRSDFGYIRGTHAVAATLLVNLGPFETFVVLANSLNRSLPLAFLANDQMAKHKFYSQFDQLFYINLDSLHTYFTETLKLHPSAYLDKIFGSLFALYMPLDILSRVWDVYAFEGDKILLRAAVAVLWTFEARLYVGKNEVLRTLTTEEWDLGKEEVFMKKMWMIRTS